MPKSRPASIERRILVVDDDPGVCEALKLLLEFDGHSVQTASHPNDALQMFREAKYDLVITDWKMPDMNGTQLAEAIKKILPGQPVVMITAHAEMLPGANDLMKCVDAIVPKPFLLEDLRKAISKAFPPG